jgi:hypothetical protein
MYDEIARWFIYVSPNMELVGQIRELFIKGFLKRDWYIPSSGVDIPDTLELSDKAKKILEAMEGDKLPNIVDKREKMLEFGAQLFDAYPSYGTANGQQTYLKACVQKIVNNRVYAGRDMYYELYYDTIKGDESKHLDILNKVKYAVDNRLPIVNMSISNFIASQSWENIGKIEDELDFL